MAAATDPTIPLPAALLVSRSSPMMVTSPNAEAAMTPPTNASRSRIEGSAMRRLAVKNSARPHAVAAMAAGDNGLGPPTSNTSPSDSPID